MKLCFLGNVQDLQPGLSELAGDYHFSLSSDGLPVTVRQQPGRTLSVSLNRGRAELVYAEKHHFFRAVGLLLEALRAGKKRFTVQESAWFDHNGPMFDTAQGNAAPTVATVKCILRQLAVLGLNTLLLYCEDNFEVPEHPYFGYGRGRYSFEELRELDDYADLFGIEMIPCIQTLAHLTDFLRWSPYKDIAEDEECLLVGEEKTYAFLEQVIRRAAAPFKTRKIHIGMDEAWKLGRGASLTRDGYTPPIQLMRTHLSRVLKITDRLGLSPMMWSDMFFRAANQGAYYTENPLPQEAIDACPENLRMIYWDYYNHTPELYEKMITEHLRFRSKPIFAGGVWTWNGFGPHWDITFEMTLRALSLCRKHGIRDLLATVWGDRGTECPCTAAMYGVAFFAEAGYQEDFSPERFRQRFSFCCGAKAEDFDALEALNRIPAPPRNAPYASNPSNYLLWQDPLFGLCDKNTEGLPLKQHYRELAQQLRPACRRNGNYNHLFRLCHALSEALSYKATLGIALKSAYDADDRSALQQLCDVELPATSRAVRRLRQVHFECWNELYKPQGWEIMDLRYGAVLARLDTARRTLRQYLSGTLSEIDQLKQPRLFFDGDPHPQLHCGDFAKVFSASRIS